MEREKKKKKKKIVNFLHFFFLPLPHFSDSFFLEENGTEIATETPEEKRLRLAKELVEKAKSVKGNQIKFIPNSIDSKFQIPKKKFMFPPEQSGDGFDDENQEGEENEEDADGNRIQLDPISRRLRSEAVSIKKKRGGEGRFFFFFF